jgi:hypothetical protein
MINSEILEIKKQFNHENCSITKVSGCYIDGEKTIRSRFTETFLCLPEEETFKYLEIFKKALSGTVEKNLINMELASAESQDILLKLRDSELKDEDLLDDFYNRVIENYEYAGNYLILLIYAAYDVPGKAKDKLQVDDASEEVYRYILCSICQVKLSKPGLSYHADTNLIQKRIQDWVVTDPANGFLYPAFNDRSTDVDNLLYFAKNPEESQKEFVDQLLGCRLPMSAVSQKETFTKLISQTLGEDCGYEIVRNIHERLNDMIGEHSLKEIPEPLTLDKAAVKELLEDSGAEDLAGFDTNYDKLAGKETALQASNLVNTRTFEVKTTNVVIKVDPEHMDLIQSKVIDGKNCLVIEVNDQVEVNGISVNVK